jgi:hypothetical protein
MLMVMMATQQWKPKHTKLNRNTVITSKACFMCEYHICNKK